jgi:hypothetical protein
MRSIKFLAKYIFLYATLLSLSGCPYDSDVPLTRSEDACIDTELWGSWLFKSTNPKDSETITIFPFNEHELLIISQEEDKINPDYYRAFISIINTDKFLNVQRISSFGEKKSWILLKYSVANGELTSRVVYDRLFKEKFTSSAALSEFIKSHLKDEDLCEEGDGTVMTFVKKVSPRPTQE